MLAEYSAANTVYLTYDGFRWQAGSFLIAGVFVYWGFILGTNMLNLPVAILSAFLIALLMSCWLLFAHHYRQLYMLKLERMWAIEQQLGMEQHLRFSPFWPKEGRLMAFPPKGHHLDIVVYLFTSIGGEVLVLFRGGFAVGELAVVFLAVGVVMWVLAHEAAMKAERNQRVAPLVARAVSG